MRLLQTDAAKVAGVSRARISQMANLDPRPGYFVDVKDYDKPLVDTENPEWKAYIEKRKTYGLQREAVEPKPEPVIVQGYSEEKVGELLTALGEKITEICKKADAKKLADALDGS